MVAHERGAMATRVWSFRMGGVVSVVGTGV